MNRVLTSIALFSIFILGMGCAGPVGSKKAAAANKQPNILVIFTDDHALQAISAYGSRINKTPNIDRLAQQGMLFRHAMVTNSICGPSRAVLLSGKYSHLNGVATNQAGVSFDGSQTTFPKLLQQAGYQTAIVGKWHLESDPTGFDFWKILPGQGDYYNPDFLTAAGRTREQGYVTDIITGEVLKWLGQTRDKSKPFLMMYQQKAPHRSWLPAERHLKLYENEVFPEPATLFDDYAGRASGAKNQEMEIGTHMSLFPDNKVFAPKDSAQVPGNARSNFGRMTPQQWNSYYAAYKDENNLFLQNPPQGKNLVRWKYQRYIKDYLRTVAAVDEGIGQVLDYLKKEGLEDNTIVVYSSDQGFYLGEHGWFDKRWMYEESLHTPLIVRWPGKVKPGSENKDLVLNLDLAETFLDAAGVAIPREMQGRSLLPLLTGATPKDWRKEIYYHYSEYPRPHRVPHHFGVRNEQYKLIYYYKLKEWEFFDLKADPREMKSQYENPAYAATISQLKTQLRGLQQQYQDPVAKEIRF
jgi:arylsulfatase A-like enzyme